jgi:hypothetical protein
MPENTSQKSKWRAFNEAFPVFQFILAGAVGLVATYTTIQLTQNSQAAEIRRHDERIGRLEKEFTPRELFDERTRTILEKQKETNDLIQKILEKK